MTMRDSLKNAPKLSFNEEDRDLFVFILGTLGTIDLRDRAQPWDLKDQEAPVAKADP